MYDIQKDKDERLLNAGENMLEEMVSSMDKVRGRLTSSGKPVLEFFQPDDVFINWIKEYAQNRLIVEIGCGSGLTLIRLSNAGARICGVDPYWDMSEYVGINMSRIQRNQSLIQVLPKRIEDVPELITNKGSKILILFCRPCHSDFVVNVLNMKDPDTEVLYITLPENLECYNDLGAHESRAKLIKHEGFSVKKEIVLSII
jgi:SAM-dependent methyltransferase